MPFVEVKRKARSVMQFRNGKTGAYATLPHEALEALGVDPGSAVCRILFDAAAEIIRFDFSGQDGEFALSVTPRGRGGMIRCGAITEIPLMDKTSAPYRLEHDGDLRLIDMLLAEAADILPPAPAAKKEAAPSLPPSPGNGVSSRRATIDDVRRRVPGALLEG